MNVPPVVLESVTTTLVAMLDASIDDVHDWITSQINHGYGAKPVSHGREN